MFVPKASAMQKGQQKSTGLICKIDVTGFLSIQVVLVAMFIAMAAPHRRVLPTSRSVDLAKADHAIPMSGARREDALVVTIQRDGQVFLGNDKVMVSELGTKISESLHRGSERKVYIQSDMHAKYGVVREILDCIRSAGIENIAFLVRERSVSPSHVP
jgi:biopolymer transport protein TolR